MTEQSTRREFLGKTIAGGLALPLVRPENLVRPAPPPRRQLSILILGGKGFIGPHMVNYATERGHELTLFNRGRTNKELFPKIENLIGDRRGDISALKGRKWDAVIDNCGYFPEDVEKSAKLLADNVKRYLFTSSLSVYASEDGTITEASAVGKLKAPHQNRITGANYGPLKALCEKAAEDALPGRAINVRPGLIVGPRDTSDRFTYWPMRIRRGGEVLAPGNPELNVQFVDARDLAGWVIRMLEAEATGVYNCVGFKGTVTLQEILHGCKIISGSEATFTWVAEKLLLKCKIQAYMEMPLWIPGGRSRYANDKAIAKGLTFRPIGDTTRDTIDWALEREKALLEAHKKGLDKTELPPRPKRRRR